MLLKFFSDLLKKFCNRCHNTHCNIVKPIISLERRIAIAFFIEKAILYECYRKQLVLDGQEAAEIEEQMLISQEHISKKAKLLMYQTFTRELMFDTYEKCTQDVLFFKAIEYARKYDPFFDLETLIDEYFEVYGIAEQLPELILKAAITNDIELENALRKHYAQ